MIVVPVLIFMAQETRFAEARNTTLLTAGFFAVCGLLLAYIAYRHWLVADVD